MLTNINLIRVEEWPTEMYDVESEDGTHYGSVLEAVSGVWTTTRTSSKYKTRDEAVTALVTKLARDP